jgi:hypothetical protein
MANKNYYGELIINQTKNTEEISIEFIGKDIIIALPDGIINDRNKIKQCFDIMGKYIEIDENAKKYILRNYPQNKRVKMEEKYYYINLENNSIGLFGKMNDDRKDFVEKRINEEMKSIGNE